MILSKLEEIIEVIEKSRQIYNTIVLTEQRGFKGQLLQLRKNIMELKRLTSPAKDEINKHIKK